MRNIVAVLVGKALDRVCERLGYALTLLKNPITVFHTQSNISIICRMVEAAKTYCSCMEDIKERLGLIKSITKGHSPLGSDGYDGEVVCLLLRRLLEQIAFSSLVAHREIYEQLHNDARTIWRAKRLLERLEKVHPEFFPSPVKRGESDVIGVQHHFELVDDGFLTKDEFVFLYDKASDGMHTWNPFKDAERVINFERSIAEWVQRIETLLEFHIVHFMDIKDVWLIQMDHPEDHKVHAFIAPAVAELAPPPNISVKFNF